MPMGKTSPGLQSLLQVLARKDAMGERAADRALAHEQLMGSLEETKARAILNTKQMELEKAKLGASLKMQKFQMQIAKMQADANMTSQAIQAKQAAQGMQLAMKADKRAQEMHDEQIKTIASQDAYKKLQLIDDGADRAMRFVTEIAPRLQADALKNATDTEGQLYSMLGQVSVQRLTNGEEHTIFIPQARFENLMKEYAKGAGLGDKPDLMRVASMWVAGIQSEYATRIAKAVASHNEAAKARGQKAIAGPDGLNPTTISGIVKDSFDAYFSAEGGIIDVAAAGHMGKRGVLEIRSKLGDQAIHEALQSTFRVREGGGTSFEKFKPDNYKGSNPHVTEYDASNYTMLKGTIDRALPIYASSTATLKSLPNQIKRAVRTSTSLYTMGQAQRTAIARGQTSGLTKDQTERALVDIAAMQSQIFTPINYDPTLADGEKGKLGKLSPHDFLKPGGENDPLTAAENFINILGSSAAASNRLPSVFEPIPGLPAQATDRRTLGSDIRAAHGAIGRAMRTGVRKAVGATGNVLYSGITGPQNWIQNVAEPYLFGIPSPADNANLSVPVDLPVPDTGALQRQFRGGDVIPPLALPKGAQ